VRLYILTVTRRLYPYTHHFYRSCSWPTLYTYVCRNKLTVIWFGISNKTTNNGQKRVLRPWYLGGWTLKEIVQLRIVGESRSWFIQFFCIGSGHNFATGCLITPPWVLSFTTWPKPSWPKWVSVIRPRARILNGKRSSLTITISPAYKFCLFSNHFGPETTAYKIAHRSGDSPSTSRWQTAYYLALLAERETPTKKWPGAKTIRYSIIVSWIQWTRASIWAKTVAYSS